jgi:hypothetical protein
MTHEPVRPRFGRIEHLAAKKAQKSSEEEQE